MTGMMMFSRTVGSAPGGGGGWVDGGGAGGGVVRSTGGGEEVGGRLGRGELGLRIERLAESSTGVTVVPEPPDEEVGVGNGRVPLAVGEAAALGESVSLLGLGCSTLTAGNSTAAKLCAGVKFGVSGRPSGGGVGVGVPERDALDAAAAVSAAFLLSMALRRSRGL